ncbi:MAG: methionyl-tRNA formyltransferase [Gammaproteobacteria bacterium]|nr:methionyl-tRNA formyltransferase [Gammaproteobacteria bacterium]
MQIGFAGSPPFAATVLHAVMQAGRTPKIVFSQPPRASGRNRSTSLTPVHKMARQCRLEVATPHVLKNQEHLFFELDLLIVAAYGLILPRAVLEAPRLGCVNVHASLLPRWRGAAPIEYAILHGDQETGVSIMRIEPKLDAGPVFRKASLPLTGNETTESLTQSLAILGGHTLNLVLEQFEKGELSEPTPQDTSLVTYAPSLKAQDARIDWFQDATKIERQIRAFVGRSAAYTMCDDIRIRILEASPVEGKYKPGIAECENKSVVIGCGTGGLALETVQLNRGRGTPMSISSALNGYANVFSDGTSFE